MNHTPQIPVDRSGCLQLGDEVAAPLRMPFQFREGEPERLLFAVEMCATRSAQNDGGRGFVMIAMAALLAPIGSYVAMTSATARQFAEQIIGACNDLDDHGAHG